VTLERPDLVRHLTFVHEPRNLPIVLSPEDRRELSYGRRREARRKRFNGPGPRLKASIPFGLD